MTPILAAALICTSPGVIDGDTLRCADGVRIRLWGVQAPERHEPGGASSTRALAALVAGRTVRCTHKGRSYRRIVARCFIGRRDIAGEMVRQGHAADWPRYSRGFYAR